MLLIAIGLGISFALLEFVLPELLAALIERAASLAFTMIVAIRTNVWYYREKTKGGAGWAL